MIRRFVREVNFMHITQNAHRLYLKEDMLGSGLISVRDIQLKCLIKLYREVIQREDNNEYKETEEMIDRIYTSQSLLNKIRIQQKYLKNDNIMETVKNREKANCDI